MSGHTPGPWFITSSCMGVHKYVEARIGGGMIQEVACCGPTEKQEQSDANARLIAAAPDLLEALTKKTKDAEQGFFEDWLASGNPTGDADEVSRQWLASDAYSEFVSEWGEQLAAITKATGGDQ